MALQAEPRSTMAVAAKAHTPRVSALASDSAGLLVPALLTADCSKSFEDVDSKCGEMLRDDPTCADRRGATQLLEGGTRGKRGQGVS
jgi:hypothetical protein